MGKHRRRSREHDEYGQRWEIMTSLWDGPRTIEEIADHFRSYLRFLGLFNIMARLERSDRNAKMMNNLTRTLDDLIAQDWVVQEGACYALTPRGREEARKPLEDMRRNQAWLKKLAEPQTVSQVTLGVHLGLAAIKLPAGLLSGSVGLLNDATDTLLDGLASLLVYFGLRLDRERVVNLVLVVLMLGTGGLTFYQAVRRFFVPFEPDADWFAFAATIVSALVCGALWAYQRFVGLRSGSLALITQSVDSRNHVIVAASVTAGLIAAWLDFGLLDTLVGLGVAVLILQSAIELLVEVVRAMGEEHVDLSRYEMGLTRRYTQFRQGQLGDWMLYLVDQGRARTRNALITQMRQALDFGQNPMLRELGMGQAAPVEKIEGGLAELLAQGWLEEETHLRVTAAGKVYLHERIRGPKESGHLLLGRWMARRERPPAS